jgi:hypothetical protein
MAIQRSRFALQNNTSLHKRKIAMGGSLRSIHPHVTGLRTGFLNHPPVDISPLNTYESSLHQSLVYKIVEGRLHGQLLSLSGMADGLQRGRGSQTIQRLCKSVSTLQRKVKLRHLIAYTTKSFLMKYGRWEGHIHSHM